MCNDDDRHLFGKRRDRLHHGPLRFVVQGACGLVQDENFGPLVQSSGDTNALALPSRKSHALLTDMGVEPLRQRDLLGHDSSEREIVEALHRWVAATPAVLHGVSLVDAVGERRAQNQPGTDQEYPNWKVPLADGTGQVVLLEDLFTNARAQSLADAMRE